MAAAEDKGGLERLMHLEVVKIHQKKKFTTNKFLVNTVDGELLFTLKEDAGVLDFLTNARIRSFQINAVDTQERQVFTLRRPSSFSSDKVEVSLGGQVVSIVRKVSTFMTPLFTINNSNDAPVLRVKGVSTNYEFELQTDDKTTIGSISKQFRGMMKEMFSYSDDYEIRFPADLDVRYKIAVIATCIFIDFKYHEK